MLCTFLSVAASVTHPPVRLCLNNPSQKFCFLKEHDDAETVSENLLALQCVICWRNRAPREMSFF